MDEEKKIVLNRAKCLDCNDIITSYHVHDYVTCSCKKLSVDGGTEYISRSYVDKTKYINMNVYADEPFDIIRKSLHWGTRGKSGKDKLKFISISEMDDDHLEKILRNEKVGANWIRDFFIKEMQYRTKNNKTKR